MSGSSTHDELVSESRWQCGNNSGGIAYARWICKSPCDGCWTKNVIGCVGQVVGIVLQRFVGHTIGVVDKGCFAWQTPSGQGDESVGHTVGAVRQTCGGCTVGGCMVLWIFVGHRIGADVGHVGGTVRQAWCGQTVGGVHPRQMRA